jgi:group I intron endonuclease
MKKIGIYKIKNIINNKIYIGQTSKNFIRRWYEHKRELRKNIHRNLYLQNAWNKYGEDNFDFDIVEEIKNIENKEELKVILEQKEQYWINYFQSLKRESGYNICLFSFNRLGIKTREDIKRRMSETRRGKKNGFYGKKHSEETKRRISESRKGKHMGGKGPMLGKKHSEESKQKMRDNQRNQNGENNFSSKLTWIQVEEIRKKYIPRKYTRLMLAKEYGVGLGCIKEIIYYKNWKIKEENNINDIT